MEEEIVIIEDNNIEEINIEEENYSGKPYELPIASKDTLGGIKVGANLTIEEDGTLNATGGSGGIIEGDTVPINAIFDYEGDTVPEGYVEVEPSSSGGNYEPNVMCLEMSKEQIFDAKTYAKVEFDISTKIGDKLIFEDNAIKIGEGVEYIKVSVIANPKSGIAGNTYIRVIKNYDGTIKNTVSWIFEKIATNWGVTCLILPPKLLKVQEGDIIALYIYTEGSGSCGPGNGAETALTVEVVK
jgi:hypothetical protein